MTPDGGSIHTTRVPLGNTDVEGLNRLLLKTEEAAELLSDIPVDVILLGCTSASFINGLVYERNMIADMVKRTGIPFTTTSTSVIRALNAMGVKKVAVATPYIDEVTQLALAYLKENGIEVCNSRGMGLLLDRDIDAVKLDDVYEFAKNTVLCTGLRTIPTIERLERRLQKPVITAIQASMWNALRMVGIDDKVEGYGSLFER